MEGQLFTHLRAWIRETGITGRPLQEQKSWQMPFSSNDLQHKHIATFGNKHGTQTCFLAFYTNLMPLQFGTSTHSSHPCLNPCALSPLPKKISSNFSNTSSPIPQVLWHLSSNSDGSERRPCFQSEPAGALLKCVPPS